MLYWIIFGLNAVLVHAANKDWQDRCNGSWVLPPSAVNTTIRLADLRQYMKETNISAYIITSSDAHQSEYTADHDKRRAYISGFSGSAGEAVVTIDKAALWTDSRYYIQAAEQMDCNWQLIPTGMPNMPSIPEWLKEVLPSGSIVSADAKLSSYQEWETWRSSLESNNINLLVTTDNLVDMVWGSNQPDYPNEPLYPLDLKYSGVTWQNKLIALRSAISSKGADSLILSALDEIAWTLNLRGGDVPFTPVFRSYLIILNGSATLYIPEDKITNAVQTHLNTLGANEGDKVQIKKYDEIWNDLEQLGRDSKKIALPTNYSYAGGVSYLLHSMLPADKIDDIVSPALIQKDYKNEAESAGMITAHIKDSVALCVFFSQITKDIQAGNKNWTELKVVSRLDSLRKQQPLSKGPSFDTIAAVGKNAALPHYEPSNETDKAVTGSELLLIDSGGQYLDGTTDVTRTVHFGTPRSDEILVYTKLLMGCIDIATTIFPEMQTVASLDILLRRPLHSLGMNYGHGSTHGIGSLLGVHEAFNSTFHLNFFGSQEPGYYKEDDFGIRLENIVRVVGAHPMSGDDHYLSFDTVTLVPYERKLIDTTIMDRRHVNWVDQYHEKVKDEVGKEMLKQGYKEEYEWLLEKTLPLS